MQAREGSGHLGEPGQPPWRWINEVLQEPSSLPAPAVQPREGKAGTRSHQENKPVALGGVWVRTKNAAGSGLGPQQQCQEGDRHLVAGRELRAWAEGKYLKLRGRAEFSGQINYLWLTLPNNSLDG